LSHLLRVCTALVQLAQELWSCKVIAFQVAHAGLEGKINPAPKVLIPFLFLFLSMHWNLFFSIQHPWELCISLSHSMLCARISLIWQHWRWSLHMNISKPHCCGVFILWL